MKDTYDLRYDAPRYVIEALSTVGRPLHTTDLADNYIPPTPNNLASVRAELRDGSRQVTNDEARRHLIENAIEEINDANHFLHDEIDEVLVMDDKGYWRLAGGVDVNKLVDRRREPLVRKAPLPDLFSKESGLWRENFRVDPHKNINELRESMKAFGWPIGMPAVMDEHGLILKGHGQITIAKELGIEPNILKHNFGDGPAADAERVAVAIASNVGFSPLTPADRKRRAGELFGDGSKFTLAEIGKLLGVSVATVSRDLRGFSDEKLNPKKGGRPRKPKADPKPEPKPEPAAEPEPTPEPKPAAEPEPTPAETPPQAPGTPLAPGGVTVNTPGMTDDSVKETLDDAEAEAAPAEETPAEELPAQAPGARTVDELVQVLVDATVALEALTEGWEDPDLPPMPVLPFTAGACSVINSVGRRLWDVGMALYEVNVSSVVDRAVKPRNRRRGRPPKHKPPFDHKPPLIIAEDGSLAFPDVSAG